MRVPVMREKDPGRHTPVAMILQPSLASVVAWSSNRGVAISERAWTGLDGIAVEGRKGRVATE